MKYSYSTSAAFVFALLALVQLTGCAGLKYTPSATPESVEEDRRFALEQQLEQDFKSIGKKYTPLTYGELTVVKPDSYKKLDSLYGVKYRNRTEKRPELENQISTQQAIISNDTTPILYVETHWFELGQDSIFEYVIAEISMKKNNKITNVKNRDYFQVSKAYQNDARLFMKEESFLAPGTYAPSDNELSFYTVYKTKAGTLQGDEKDAFMEHTFLIMQLAQKANTLSTEVLLRILALAQLKKDFPTMEVSTLAAQTDEISDTSSGKPVFQYYLVTVTDSGPQKHAPIVYKYDPYLQLIP